MITNIRRIIVLLIMTTLGSCSGSCTWMQPEITGRNVNSLDQTKKKPLAVAVVTLRKRGTPVRSTKIEFSRPIAGQATNAVWSETTDENGQARIEFTPGGNVSDDYIVRAMANGSQIASWSSISVKEGYEVRFDLPIGEEAQLTGSSHLPRKDDTDGSSNMNSTK